MTHLLQETIRAIANSGHTPYDIAYIGNSDGLYCTWESFQEIADVEYDNGYGSARVAVDLLIVFSDGSKMWRDEYDGQEWWNFDRPFEIPVLRQPITKVVGDLWPTLAELNCEDGEDMKFTLEIEMGNEAMRSPEDVAKALRNVAHRLPGAMDAGYILDENGNNVGEWAFRGSP